MIQWEKNKRWNQRWRFNRQGKGVIIQSVFNGLSLDIAEEKRESGAKVVQWEQTGGSNQQWFPEQAGNGVYKFRSVHEPSLFLGIKKQNVDNGGQLEVTSEDNPSIYWRVEGAQPWAFDWHWNKFIKFFNWNNVNDYDRHKYFIVGHYLPFLYFYLTFLDVFNFNFQSLISKVMITIFICW